MPAFPHRLRPGPLALLLAAAALAPAQAGTEFLFRSVAPTNAGTVQSPNPAPVPVPVVDLPADPAAPPPMAGLNYVAGAVAVSGEVIAWSLRDNPDWLGVDAAGKVSGTPPLGTVSFSYTVVATDRLGRSTAKPSGLITLLVPTATVADLSGEVREGDAAFGRLATNLPAATWSKVSGADWLRVGTDGGLSGDAPDVSGPETYSVTARAASGLAGAEVTASVTVSPAATIVTGTPPSLMAGMFVSGQATTDLGAGALYALEGAPAWLGIDPETGALTGKAATGQPAANVTAVASRNGAIARSAPFAIAVTQPTVSLGTVPTQVFEGRALAGKLATNLPDAAWEKVSGPDWIFVGPDGTVSGTAPEVDAHTPTPFTARASSNGATVDLATSVRINAESVAANGIGWAVVGEAVSTRATSTIPGATFSVANAPAWLSLSPSGQFSGTPVQGQGATDMVVTATNGTVKATVRLAVTVSLVPSHSYTSNSPGVGAVVGMEDGSDATYVTLSPGGYSVYETFSSTITGDIACFRVQSTGSDLAYQIAWSNGGQYAFGPQQNLTTSAITSRTLSFSGTSPTFYLINRSTVAMRVYEFKVGRKGVCP